MEHLGLMYGIAMRLISDVPINLL